MKVLASKGDDDLDHADAMRGFLKLYRQIDEPAVRSILTSSQYSAINRLYGEFGVVNDMPKGFMLFVNEHFRNAPEWDAMRQAARDAIKALES